MITARQRVGLRVGPKNKNNFRFRLFFIFFIFFKVFRFLFLLLLKTVNFVKKKKEKKNICIPHSLISESSKSF